MTEIHFPPSLTESPGWKKARKLKAVQRLTTSASDGEWTLRAREVLADIEGTYVVIEVKENKGPWEFTDASLADEKGRVYAYLGCFQDCGVLHFEPLQDNPGNLTLTVKKLGLLREPFMMWDSVVYTEYDVDDDFDKIPMEVKEKLTRWGLLEKEEDPPPPAGEQEPPTREDDHYIKELKGHWTLQFPVSTLPRERYASITVLDRKIPLFNASLVLKRLVKSLHKWVIQYDIVDERGRSEAEIAREHDFDTMIALARESSTCEEYLEKKDAACPPFRRILPRFDYHLRSGTRVITSWNFNVINRLNTHGLSSLTFAPQRLDAPLVLLLHHAENISSLHPFIADIELVPERKRKNRLFHVDFIHSRHQGSFRVNQVRRDYNQEDRVIDREEEIRKEMPLWAAESFIEDCKTKRLRVDYKIATARGERLFLDPEHLEVLFDGETITSRVRGSHYLYKNMWEGYLEIFDVPEGAQKLTIRTGQFIMHFASGAPMEIAVE